MTPSDQRLQGRDILLVSSDDWEAGLKTSKHQLTSRLALDNRVLFVESIGLRRPSAGSKRDKGRIAKKVRRFLAGPQPKADNLWVFTPLAIPLHDRPWARRFNAWFVSWSVWRTARKLGFQRPLLWMFLPSAAGLVGRCGESLVIYYNVDDFAQFTGSHKPTVVAMDEQLTRAADVVFATSEPLTERKRELNPNTYQAPHGVDYQHFRAALDGPPPPPELAGLVGSGPIIGYWGWINDYFALDEIATAAEARPEWQFVLIGAAVVDVSRLESLPNVHLLGSRPYEVLPQYAAHCDVLLIPFRINELTHHVNPLKLREYLAAGVPVVSTPMPDVVATKAAKYGEAVELAETGPEFIAAIEQQLAVPKSERAEAISALVADESWEARLARVSERVLEAEANKGAGR
jgi:glycosyltransferase involved in cell wall biosynthesis